MKIYNDLSTAKNGENVYGTANAVKCYDSFTQVTYNKTSGILLAISMPAVLLLKVSAV